jgi:uncharacterized membrane protein (UPF0182 family)
VQSTGDLGYPTLQYVAAVYGDRVGFASTLTEALNQVFGAGAGNSAQPDQGAPAPSPSTPASPAPAPPSGGQTVAPNVQALITQAAQAYDQGQAALRRGDFAAYGQAQTRLKTALDQLNAQAKPTPTPSPSPSAASPTPRPAAPAPAGTRATVAPAGTPGG